MLHKIFQFIHYSQRSIQTGRGSSSTCSATAGWLDIKDNFKKVGDEVPAPCYGSPRARAEEEVIFLSLSFEFFNHIL